MNTYFTIEKNSSIETKEKSSKFISFIFPIDTELQAKKRIEELWAIHPKATHICYAYRLGFDKNLYRTNDDGEPSGTAGKPILGQIDAHHLTQVLIAVVRYYGGVKLGVSGLIQAYKEGALEVIETVEIVEKDIIEVYQVSCSTQDYNLVIAFLKKQKAQIMQQKFENECLIDIGIALKFKDGFFIAISELYQVNLKISPLT